LSYSRSFAPNPFPDMSLSLQCLHDKETIHRFLAHHPAHYLYLIGDLDDFFWPHTQWFAGEREGKIQALALLYLGPGLPTLLAFHDGDPEDARALLRAVRPYLPRVFLAHLSSGLMEVFGQEQVIQYYGHNHKMALKQPPPPVDDPHIQVLSPQDLPAAEQLLAAAYPDNWFDPRMLNTGRYLGYFEQERLLGIAGVHVCSATYRVAALGNVATHPDARRCGIARKLVAQLCAVLAPETDHIGLNVRAENAAAIRMYEQLGFGWIGNYDECKIRLQDLGHGL
jgi:GNAT superfamily N-acetyltransferase